MKTYKVEREREKEVERERGDHGIKEKALRQEKIGTIYVC